MRHLIAAVLVCTGSVFAADPQLVNMAPPDAAMFAGVNVEQAKTSPLGVFLLAQVPVVHPDFQKFIDATGFDPRRDIREVLIVTSTMSTPGVHPSSGLFLVKGTFDIPRLVAAAKADGKMTVSTVAGAQFLTTPEDQGSLALGLVDAQTAVAGDAASVRAALARRTQVNIVDPALMAQINTLSTGSDAWSVTAVGALNKMPKATGPAVALQAVQQVTGTIKLGTVVTLNATATADTVANAASLSDVLKFGAQMIGMQNGLPVEFAGLLKNLMISPDGLNVNVAFSVPEDQIETMMKAEHAKQGVHAGHGPGWKI